MNGDESECAAVAESLSLTCLMALEQVPPAVRAAFLLHRMFGRSRAETACTVGVSDAACDQFLLRGHRIMMAAKPTIEAERWQRREVTKRFFEALQERDERGLAESLAPDAVAYTSADKPPTVGRRKVAGLLGRMSPDLGLDQLGISIAIGGGLVQTVRRQGVSTTGDSA
jgi:limonene-1,2-epoxide hydrolase